MCYRVASDMVPNSGDGGTTNNTRKCGDESRVAGQAARGNRAKKGTDAFFTERPALETERLRPRKMRLSPFLPTCWPPPCRQSSYLQPHSIWRTSRYGANSASCIVRCGRRFTKPARSRQSVDHPGWIPCWKCWSDPAPRAVGRDAELLLSAGRLRGNE